MAVLNSLAVCAYLIAIEVLGVWRRCFGRSENTLQSGRRLLIIGPLPPPVNGGVFRPSALAKYAQRNGWKADLLGLSSAPDIEDESGLLAEVVKSGSQYHRVVRDKKFSWRLSVALGVDGGAENIYPIVRAGWRIVREGGYGAIVASGPPFVGFVAARYISILSGVPLVLDYRDEWSQNPFQFVDKSKLAIWAERCALAHAKVSVFTTESQRSNTLESFSLPVDGGSLVVPNGVEDDHIPNVSVDSYVSPDAHGKILSMAFFGVLGTHTASKNFLEQLQAVRTELRNRTGFDLKFSVVGSVSSAVTEILGEHIRSGLLELAGSVPPYDVITTMEQFDALVLLTGENFERYIPGKLYYYMASSRPLVGIGPSGEASKAFEKADAGWWVGQDCSGLVDILEKLTKPPGKSSNQKRKDFVDCHVRSATSGKFFEELDRLVKSQV